jgi:hypothetical protein
LTTSPRELSRLRSVGMGKGSESPQYGIFSTLKNFAGRATKARSRFS